MMKHMEIFEQAMCCPTGLCGPSIDPELLRVSTVWTRSNSMASTSAAII